MAQVTSLSQCLFTCTCRPLARCSDIPRTPRPRKRFPILLSSKINMPKNIRVSQGLQRRLLQRPKNQAPGTPRACRSPFEATKYARVGTTWQSRDGLTSKRSRPRAWAFVPFFLNPFFLKPPFFLNPFFLKLPFFLKPPFQTYSF